MYKSADRLRTARLNIFLHHHCDAVPRHLIKNYVEYCGVEGVSLCHHPETIEGEDVAYLHAVEIHQGGIKQQKIPFH